MNSALAQRGMTPVFVGYEHLSKWGENMASTLVQILMLFSLDSLSTRDFDLGASGRNSQQTLDSSFWLPGVVVLYGSLYCSPIFIDTKHNARASLGNITQYPWEGHAVLGRAYWLQHYNLREAPVTFLRGQEGLVGFGKFFLSQGKRWWNLLCSHCLTFHFQ